MFRILSWVSILILGTALSAMAQEGALRAAVVCADLPGEDAALATALQERVGAAGYEVEVLDAAGLCDAARLSPDRIDLLVLPNAAALPAASVATIGAYLAGGGDIVALNAPLWRSLLIKPGDAWVTRDEYERATAAEPPERVLFDFTPDDIAGWQRARFPEGPATYETCNEGPAPGQRALHARVANLQGWDNFGPASVAGVFPESHTLTVFSAKGGPNTRALAVEWQEQDGSRWIATVPLTTEWRRYVLTPEDFKFWESVPARANDRLHPENAARMNIGMAFTHTGATPGAHEWWVGPFGTARLKESDALLFARPAIPPMDLLAPGYKFFDSTGVAALRAYAPQSVAAAWNHAVPSTIRSIQPRPNGGGFGKGRDWRWMPLLEASAADGAWRGNPAALMVHCAGTFQGGQWAAFGIEDGAWYRSPAALDLVESVAQKMRSGAYLIDGGADFFTYFADQGMTFGARVANVGRAKQEELVARVSVANRDDGALVFAKEWPVALDPGTETTVRESWTPPVWPAKGFAVTVELLRDGKVVDIVAHEAFVWRPKEPKAYVAVERGDFMLEGKRWRAHGVNYMPSSGIGTEDGDYFEQWIGPRAYDPEIVQRDLDHIHSLGLNSVSIFLCHKSMAAQNLLDLLRRLDLLGMKANLSLRPGTPLDFQWPEMREMIQYYRLWENDAVYAYDLAWEPLWMEHKDRTRWDGQWADWIVERYGSVENAERDWGVPVPRDDAGTVTNPADEQVVNDGEGRRMVAAYRRFLDTLLYKYYGKARALVRSVDPNHLVSFRMTEAGDPTMQWGAVMPYDFPYLAAAVDILEPEGYGRIGDWERVKPGGFEFEYARWAAPELPMIWAEAGVHVWDVAAGAATPEKLAYQGQYLCDFYRMMISSGADGIYWWWYPGGFRFGENSDYGIINCDGTDRPASQAIRENAAALIDGPDAKPVDYWIEFDRDRLATGIVGTYASVKDEFWKAVEDGKTPGLRTAGTGTDSGNCPLLAVGSTPCNGSNPPKYLDAYFDRVEVRDPQGRWIEIEKGGSVPVTAGQLVLARVTATNLAEATWRAQGEGAVALTITCGDATSSTPLPDDLPSRQSVCLKNIELTPAASAEPTTVTLGFEAKGRTPFGERYTVTLRPE